jgi:CMP-N-acetylneuraminic acid synthetase
LNSDILCIIPARGGSKRIPRKNVRILAGRPLVAHTITTALEAEVFAKVVVSSDDEQVLKIATEFGVEPDRRPTELCGDDVSSDDVIAEILYRPTIRDSFAAVAMMLPTCPLCTVADVQGAVAEFERADCEGFLFTVREYEFPVQLALHFDEDSGSTLDMVDTAAWNGNRLTQNYAPHFHPNGALYLASVESFLTEGSFFGRPLRGYRMPPERSLDIDYPYQFELAEAWMGRLKLDHQV